MYCSACEVESSGDGVFCPQCGSKLEALSHNNVVSLTQRIQELKKELSSVEDSLEFQSYGLYEPRFGLGSSREYTDKLTSIREQQKLLIKKESVVDCPKVWMVDGSQAKGRTMLKEQTTLMLLAFNGACDSVVSSAKFGNIAKLEKRITKEFEKINKLGSTKQLSITKDYLQLKHAELHLVHEKREIEHREREEERSRKQELRESEKAEKEIARIKLESEKQENKLEKELEKAKSKAETAKSQTEKDKLEEMVASLLSKLEETRTISKRSIARAELSKSGHVYVLSNLGTLGEGVYKIGMTRRFEPLERIKDLNNAAVPFNFDYHLMLYTDDAPALEKALHNEFDNKRINLINRRKEYFRVTSEEILEAVKKHYHREVSWLGGEAEDFQKSKAKEAV